jgi:hypothetical protein
MSNSRNFKAGDRIRAISAFGHHSYQPGITYIVTQVDSGDSTLRARDSSGTVGNWIKWADCCFAHNIGFDWLKTVLPPEALDILSAFDGLDHLSLREEIRDQLVLKIPNLHARILETQANQEAALERESLDEDSDEDDNEEGEDEITGFELP